MNPAIHSTIPGITRPFVVRFGRTGEVIDELHSLEAAHVIAHAYLGERPEWSPLVLEDRVHQDSWRMTLATCSPLGCDIALELAQIAASRATNARGKAMTGAEARGRVRLPPGLSLKPGEFLYRPQPGGRSASNVRYPVAASGYRYAYMLREEGEGGGHRAVNEAHSLRAEDTEHDRRRIREEDTGRHAAWRQPAGGGVDHGDGVDDVTTVDQAGGFGWQTVARVERKTAVPGVPLPRRNVVRGAEPGRAAATRPEPGQLVEVLVDVALLRRVMEGLRRLERTGSAGGTTSRFPAR